MLKRLLLLAGLLLAAPAFAAGTVPGFSLTPQFDTLGKVVPGCKLYVIQAGTTSTPQSAYQDTGLTQVLPNPLTCDAAGRLPQWFVADGLIKVRLTDRNGAAIFVGDNLLVVGPSSGGGGGGGTVDPTTIANTGDMKFAYGTNVLTGWVRLNGRTIGSSTSGATERANADTQALFNYLWNTDANLTVSGGRGVSAAADWSANKTIALPDWRGRALAGLDDMGASPANRLDASMVSPNPTTLGAFGGVGAQTLTLAQLPPGITSSGTGTASVGDGGRTIATGNIVINTINTSLAGGSSQTLPYMSAVSGGSWNSVTALTGTSTAAVTSTNTLGQSFLNLQPTKLTTFYIKL